MKTGSRPKYYDNAKVSCACGNTFFTGSVLPEIKVEICSVCHPFYTGEMKYVDTLGRVEKFKQKQAQSAGKKYLKKKQRKAIKIKEATKKAAQSPKTLKDMLKQAKSQSTAKSSPANSTSDDSQKPEKENKNS